MILVVGRPGLDEQDGLNRMAGRVALEAARSGGRVELVGSVGDDRNGELVSLALGQAGIGHAALLRDPAGSTPQVGGPGGPLPRLDERDVELGLSYLTECHVLVVAEPLGDQVLRVAREAADYHGAHLVVLAEPGSAADVDGVADADVDGAADADVARAAGADVDDAPETANRVGAIGPPTVLELPEHDDGAFARLVGRYAAELAVGAEPAVAWQSAVRAVGWEHVPDDGGTQPGAG